ncbi:serine/threonine-protein kinase [Nocardioides jiangxiensis]|uniref:non-specific serine/threonine protein kinase n=1 Tax=Nocardioides jiangxiensis TaxID=3064524 RepID=A0ABT9B3U6_9ACTN|nr:serine/threonine-protein kinase [Nocardioides sp. WY-20]MDO7867976.1 serine/threonine-protein kinase [Nocardioides sp. WY-20]
MTVGTGSLLGGRYRVGDLLGQGGMAEVYRATDERLGREVAVKVLRLRADEGSDRARFAAEARTLARLDHPSIVTLLDAGLEEAQPWLAMELVDGTHLGSRFGSGPLPAAEVALVGQQVAEALAYAHATGVVHRDVKPGNILLAPDRRALLADFGIAHALDSATRHTAVGQSVGSPAWLAPEQAAGEGVSGASDVYSLGLVLLEALTGERAFTGTPTELVHARLAAAPVVPPSLPPGWAALLRAMTALAPADRVPAEVVAVRLAGFDGVDLPPDPDATAAFVAAPDPGETQLLAVAPDGATGRRSVIAAVPRGLWAVAAVLLALLIVLVLWLALRGDPEPVAPRHTTTPMATPTTTPTRASSGPGVTPSKQPAQHHAPAKKGAGKKGAGKSGGKSQGGTKK